MSRLNFGTKNQVSFHSENEFYETLGFLAKPEKHIKIVWEPNEESGAWGSEGRIQCYRLIDDFPISLSRAFTAGVGNIIFRINCNDYVRYLVENHNFQFGEQQDYNAIKSTVPIDFASDFEKGYNK